MEQKLSFKPLVLKNITDVPGVALNFVNFSSNQKMTNLSELPMNVIEVVSVTNGAYWAAAFQIEERGAGESYEPSHAYFSLTKRLVHLIECAIGGFEVLNRGDYNKYQPTVDEKGEPPSREILSGMAIKKLNNMLCSSVSMAGMAINAATLDFGREDEGRPAISMNLIDYGRLEFRATPTDESGMSASRRYDSETIYGTMRLLGQPYQFYIMPQYASGFGRIGLMDFVRRHGTPNLLVDAIYKNADKKFGQFLPGLTDVCISANQFDNND